MNIKKLTKVILVNILIVIFLFFLLELAVRLFFPQIQLSGTDSSLYQDSVYFNTPGLKPNSSGKSYGAFKEVNDDGFWKYSRSKTFEKNKSRWLFLGDSITMGIGVDNDSSFAGLINTQKDSIEILNAALIGYSGYAYLNVIKKLFEKDQNALNIKKVFIFWCLNDVYDFFPTSNSPHYEDKSILGGAIKLLTNNFKAWHLFKELFSDRQKDYFLFDNQFYSPSDSLFNRTIINIEKCASIVSSFNAEFDVIILPYEYQVRNFSNRELFQPQRVLYKQLSQSGVKCFDLSDYFKPYQSDSKSLYLFGDGIHFSNKGHRLISKIFLENIKLN